VENVQWGPTATIIYPLGGRGRVKLSDQHSEMQATVRGGIAEVIRCVIAVDAFPTHNSHIESARSVLIIGTKEVRAHEIVERLKCDNKFVRDLEELV
jgi:hypothetical protein